ncbi:hypothetical protein WKI13_11020 [Teredinibacter turnerae]|uniref:hypothetical protein n=1 Tax=Teredinibacter turnerae TaxID=2426 RepID=UPI00036CC255|nr:hypothetical protein [Teredinibacter turnerae]
MNAPKRLLLAAAIAAVAQPVFALDVSYSINADNVTHEISPLIYGTNHRMYMTGNENISFYRIGGNRLSAYNWENNFSNAGSDWLNSSDTYMGY